MKYFSRYFYFVDIHIEPKREWHYNLLILRSNQAQLQIQRKDQLNRFCRNKKIHHNEVTSKRNQLRSWQHFIYSDTYQVLYCYIPKVACTNWKWIMYVLDHNHLDSLDVFHKQKVHEELKLNIVQNEFHYMQKKKYFTFLFVRHPFERLISAYRNKILEPYPDDLRHVVTTNKNILLRYRENITNIKFNETKATFEEFIRYLIDIYKVNGIRKFDEHWGGYTELCNICFTKFDFIGKFESLIEDSRSISSLLNTKEHTRFPENRTDMYQQRSGELINKYFKTVARENILRLYEIYKYDFEAFGYNISNIL